MVDLRAGYWTPALFEEALTAAGGGLDAARRTGIEIRNDLAGIARVLIARKP